MLVSLFQAQFLVSDVDDGTANSENTGESIDNRGATTINGQNPAILDAEIRKH